MNEWGVIIIAAALAEASWETAKLVWQSGKLSINTVGALIVGIIIAVGANVDIGALVGINFVYPIIGQVLTGILLSRGANFLHDFLSIIKDGSAAIKAKS